MKCGIFGAVALAAFGFGAGDAVADSQLVLGGGAGWAPDYRGSDDYHAIPVPMVSYSWSGETAQAPASGYKSSLGLIDVRAGVPDGVDVGVARIATPTRNYTLRVGAGYRFGRDADDNSALHGMGDIDGQGIARVTLASEPADPRGFGTFYGVKYEADVTGETEGDTLTLFGGHTLALTPQSTLTLSGHAQWADSDYMHAYFGVSDKQASRSGYGRFDASSGFADVGVEARINWSLTEHWMLIGSLGYNRLLGDAADSPIVDGPGSANQILLTTGVAYRF